MMQNIIDSISHNNKLNMNTKLKVLFTMITLIICIFSKSIIVPLIIILIMVVLTLFVAKIPAKLYFKIAVVPLGFSFFSLIMMSLLFGTNVWFNIVDLGFFKINLLKDGTELGLLVFFRGIGAMLCALLLILTTPMTELFYVFKWLKMPSVVIDIAMMMYRYIFVLIEELFICENAQKTRLGYKNLKTTYNSLGLLASNLFIKSWDRGEMLYTTMGARGYNGELNILDDLENPKLVYLLICGIFWIFLIIISYLTKDFKVIDFIF